MSERNVILDLGENTILFLTEGGDKICTLVILLDDDSIDMTMVDMYDLEKAKVGMQDGRTY